MSIIGETPEQKESREAYSKLLDRYETERGWRIYLEKDVCSDLAEDLQTAIEQIDGTLPYPSGFGVPCDICARRLGGGRYTAHYCDADGAIMHLEICADCVYFMEYGRLDDQTMLDVAEG